MNMLIETRIDSFEIHYKLDGLIDYKLIYLELHNMMLNQNTIH